MMYAETKAEKAMRLKREEEEARKAMIKAWKHRVSRLCMQKGYKGHYSDKNRRAKVFNYRED